MQLAFANCRGFSRMKPLIERLCCTERLHVLGLAETWTAPRHKLQMSGYTVFRRDRPCPPGQGPRGGVALLIDTRVRPLN